MLQVLTPMLLGLLLLSFLLPSLTKLKLAGLEAELSQPNEKISKGPTGRMSRS